MSIKKIAVSAGITLTIAGGATAAYVANVAHKSPAKVAYISQVTPITSFQGDVNFDALSQPTQPIVKGQVNQAFINRFDNAVQLNSNGQYVIQKNMLPVNATTSELAALNQFVSSANTHLGQVMTKVPKANMVKKGNSVIIAQTPPEAQKMAQTSTAETITTHHFGTTYVWAYWWGQQIGLNQNDAKFALGGGLIVGGAFIDSIGVGIAFQLLGLAIGIYLPGGIWYRQAWFTNVPYVAGWQ